MGLSVLVPSAESFVLTAEIQELKNLRGKNNRIRSLITAEQGQLSSHTVKPVDITCCTCPPCSPQPPGSSSAAAWQSGCETPAVWLNLACPPAVLTGIVSDWRASTAGERPGLTGRSLWETTNMSGTTSCRPSYILIIQTNTGRDLMILTGSVTEPEDTATKGSEALLQTWMNPLKDKL